MCKERRNKIKTQFEFERKKERIGIRRSMKSSLKKLRGLALHNHHHNKHDTILPLKQLDELEKATRVG